MLPQKFNCFHRFHFQLPLSHPLLSMKQVIVFSVKKNKKQASLFCKLFYLTYVVDRAWYGMEDDFSIFHTGTFLPFYFHFILKIFHSIFHSILKFSSIFHSIPPYQRNLDWKQCNVYFAALHLCHVLSNRS